MPSIKRFTPGNVASKAQSKKPFICGQRQAVKPVPAHVEKWTSLSDLSAKRCEPLDPDTPIDHKELIERIEHAADKGYKRSLNAAYFGYLDRLERENAVEQEHLRSQPTFTFKTKNGTLNV